MAPNQVRQKTAAMEVRSSLAVQTATVALCHARLNVTEVYSDRDL